jgi:hypothetical protein
MLMHRRLKTSLRGAGIALGVGAVVVGVKWTGVDAIHKALSQVGPNIAWMFAAYAAGTAVGAVPWRKLLPDWARPSWGATLTSRFAASGINALLPFFGLGEASRLLWLPRGERSPGLAALVVDRLLFLAAGMPILVIAALAATRVPAVPAGYLLAVLISASVIFIAVAVVAIGAARGRLVGRLRWALIVFGVPTESSANPRIVVSPPAKKRSLAGRSSTVCSVVLPSASVTCTARGKPSASPTAARAATTVRFVPGIRRNQNPCV